MFHVPEKYRLANHPVFPSIQSDGNSGFFIIPHYRITDYVFHCGASDGGLEPGQEWEHISVSVIKKGEKAKRCPTWEEMCWIKDLFWDKDDCVMQLHPPQSEYVSTHNFCLHLWKPVHQAIPMPPSIMVGRKDLKHEDLQNASGNDLRKIISDEAQKHLPK